MIFFITMLESSSLLKKPYTRMISPLLAYNMPLLTVWDFSKCNNNTDHVCRILCWEFVINHCNYEKKFNMYRNVKQKFCG